MIVTDLQRAGWEGESSSSLPAGWGAQDVVKNVLKDVSKRAPNLAVTAATVGVDRIVAAIRNGGATAQHRQGPGPARRTAKSRLPTMPHRPARRSKRRILWRAPEAGTLSVAVDDAEGLPADNVRFVALGSRGAPRALIITADEPACPASGRPAALYVSRALGTRRARPSRSSPDARSRPCRPTRCRTIEEWRCCRLGARAGRARAAR